jgi:LmbE family N-acetylglucosaminyl deacetylase
MKMNSKTSKSIVVIVAHPDDETLWAGGTILSHPHNKWFVVCLCRASDTERSPRFYNALKLYKAEGIMGDLDDSPDQHPLDEKDVEKEILRLLPTTHFDLILTHNSTGEYTKHLRHEEVNKAVVTLWHNGGISAKELWTFAYEDGNKAYFPQIVENANIIETLSEKIWTKKYKIITKTYNFDKDSWEAETTPTSEAFWQFKNPHEAKKSASHFDNDIKMSKLSIYELSSKTKN